MPTLVLATHNAHKVEEIRRFLGDPFEYRTLRDFANAPVTRETGATFTENAQLKAHALAAWFTCASTHPNAAVWGILADDSGLEVDALGGAPGVHSARFAAEAFGLSGNAPDGANNARLLQSLADVPWARRTARFRCVLALVEMAGDRPGTIRCFDGTCEGRIGLVQRGASGFGYDPLFLPTGFDTTFAELGADVKSRISHRAQALTRLQEAVRRTER